jgi:putative flippase GtrA
MTLVLSKITETLWRMVPGPLRRRLRSEGGRRLVRFAPAAVLALCATQITYLICQIAGVTAGLAGAAGWFAGVAVSYVVSRWAWERKGRPHLLKETLPFVGISLCVGVVLTLTSKLAHQEARVLGLHRIEEVVFAQGLYLLANCVTFVIRFVIFHYVLFADRSARLAGPAGDAAGGAARVPAAVTPSASGSPAPGSPASDGSAANRRSVPPGGLPPGTRR